MTSVTKPAITTWISDPLHETKPLVLPMVSRASSIRELISHLKSSFRESDYLRVEEILTDRESQFRVELETMSKERDLSVLDKLKVKEQCEELKRKIVGLESEKSGIEVKLKCYEVKFGEMDSRMSRLEEEIARRHDVDVSVIRKIAEDLEKGEDDEVVVVNSGDEDPLPTNLACENRATILNLSACERNTGSPGSSNAIHIIDSDDEMARQDIACVSNGHGVGRNLAFPLKIKEEDITGSSASLSTRKRSLSETDNGDGCSFGRQKTRSIQELNCDGKRSLPREPEKVSIRQYADKVGEKCQSRLSPRRCALFKLDGISDESSSDSDNDPDSDRNMNLLFKRVEGRRFPSEDSLRLSFEKDFELCMNAVCALYRQQIKGLSSAKSQGTDHVSISALGEYLIDGHPEYKLRKAVADVRPKDHEECKRLATKHYHQLYQIYISKQDHLFQPGAVYSSYQKGYQSFCYINAVSVKTM